MNNTQLERTALTPTERMRVAFKYLLAHPEAYPDSPTWDKPLGVSEPPDVPFFFDYETQQWRVKWTTTTIPAVIKGHTNQEENV